MQFQLKIHMYMHATQVQGRIKSEVSMLNGVAAIDINFLKNLKKK